MTDKDSDEKLLPRVNGPRDLRDLDVDDLSRLADEIRQLIIDTVSLRGGHLASNLGVADLVVALHTVFDFATDRLIFDVGHQCYAHKILTGRRDEFSGLRQAGGLSGFPSPAESPFDPFYSGHAGTAISAALGLAWADQLSGRADRKIVAVVGDASIVNGVAMEALNNALLLNRQLLVILNDNSMAIDVTQGAIAHVLDRIRLTRTYSDLKNTAETVLKKLPLGENISEALRHLKEGLRASLHGEQLFESFGFRYFGPVDGHDIGFLQRTLRAVATVNEPVLLHVHTQKGRGCDYAVEDPCRFHSPSAHRVNGGVVEFPKTPRLSWTKAFSRELVELAERDQRVVALTAAMPDGTGLSSFRDRFPTRYIDVGINECHAVAMAGALASSGLRPVVAIYSTFMQRAFDQAFQEVALQGAPVLLCLDRAGLCGSDGAVHHGFADIAFLRLLPNMVLISPADQVELRGALALAVTLQSPVAIRYPRDEAPEGLAHTDAPFELGKAVQVREGDDAILLALGAMVEHAVAAAEALASTAGLECAVYSARFAKPLDETLIADLIRSGKPVLTVEDHAVAGGFGSAVVELAARLGLNASNVRVLGLPDRFIAHATRQEQLAEVGLDSAGVARSAAEAIAHVAPAGLTPRRNGVAP